MGKREIVKDRGSSPGPASKGKGELDTATAAPVPSAVDLSSIPLPKAQLQRLRSAIALRAEIKARQARDEQDLASANDTIRDLLTMADARGVTVQVQGVGAVRVVENKGRSSFSKDRFKALLVEKAKLKLTLIAALEQEATVQGEGFTSVTFWPERQEKGGDGDEDI